MRLIQSLLIVTLLAAVAGCSWFKSDDDVPPDQGERQLYEAARKNLDANNYDLAIKNLQLLEARYPFGPYAEQAQLELIYAHFRNYDHEEAVAAADRFIRRLSRLQGALGVLNDSAVAADLMSELGGPGGRHAYAVGVVQGFMAARATMVRPAILAAWEKFRRVAPFWA